MRDAVLKYTALISTPSKAAGCAKCGSRKGVHIDGDETKGEVMSIMFEELVEEHLVQPVFIMTILLKCRR